MNPFFRSRFGRFCWAVIFGWLAICPKLSRGQPAEGGQPQPTNEIRIVEAEGKVEVFAAGLLSLDPHQHQPNSAAGLPAANGSQQPCRAPLV